MWLHIVLMMSTREFERVDRTVQVLRLGHLQVSSFPEALVPFLQTPQTDRNGPGECRKETSFFALCGITSDRAVSLASSVADGVTRLGPERAADSEAGAEREQAENTVRLTEPCQRAATFSDTENGQNAAADCGGSQYRRSTLITPQQP